jgi:hypothetical protein
MKKILFIAAAAAFASCNNGTATNEHKDSTKAATADVTYAYPINYSAKFEMGDPAKAQKVTELWKDFDDNKLNNQKNTFADSVEMYFSGMEMKGPKDSMFAGTQAYRDQFSSVKSSIDAVMSTKSIDKDKEGGDWVSVWGSEIKVSKAGKTDSSRLHEIWHFDKNGKVDYMSQYRQEYAMKKK